MVDAGGAGVGAEFYGVTDRGDGKALLDGGGGQECTGAAEQDAV